MEAFLVSTGVVALAEIGDKTQLLSLLLAARFRKPLPLGLGILAATIVNHGLTAFVGVEAGDLIPASWQRWIVAIAFFAVAGWALIPDKMSDDDAPTAARSNASAFMAAMISFFIVEMGDKTQVATLMLAAKFNSIFAVALGTTFGMMLANVPALLFGDRLLARLPLQWIRIGAAVMFAVLGAIAILY
jgi:putative Ca2+/H+ antiporter (TMEM165/GDT1 family)